MVDIAIGTTTDTTITKMMRSSHIENSLTDLHTHILPAFDDGAENLQIALDILRAEKKMGVDRVALTPHYYPMREELDAFLIRRQQAYSALLSCWDEETMPRLRLGAEVQYTPQLVQMNLHQLTIERTNYLLLELPYSDVVPCVRQVVDAILKEGITPIIAHVERCAIFRNEPDRLQELIQMGALAQVDVEAFTNRCDARFAKICLSRGLAQIIASDIHNLTDRSLNIGTVATEQYTEILQWSERFARAVWDQTPLPAFAIRSVKKVFWGYQ